jgi:hypothetical protein
MSVFFLPVTFVTSYFSVEIPGFLDSYTDKTYWIAFVIIIGVSFLSLFFFSRMLTFLSEILEEWATSGFLWLRESLRQAGGRSGRSGRPTVKEHA